VIYVDKDGRIFWLIPVAAALIGGTINVVQNWDNIDGNWLKGIGYFALGSGNAALSVTMPGYAWAGGAALGFGNTLLGGGNIGQAFLNAGISAASSYVGAKVGNYVSKYTAGLNFNLNGFNLNGPAIKGLISGGITGYATSFASATTASLLQGHSFSEAIEAGKSAGPTGGVLGGFSGLGAGYYNATKMGVSPWTGEQYVHNINSNRAVLGPYKVGEGEENYINYAKARGSSYFSISSGYCETRYNYNALDIWGSKGLPIDFSTPLNLTNQNSFVRVEATYIQQNYNYEWVYDVEGNIVGMRAKR